MTALILGLALFLGVHSIRVVAENVRTRQIQRLGLNGWKGVYSVASLAGFILLLWGFGAARAAPLLVWSPPLMLRHPAMLLILLSLILLAAAYVPGNRFKARIGHPMLAGVALWAIAHLLVDGRAHAMLVFGAFLIWAVAAFIAARGRDKAAGVTYAAGPAWKDIVVIVLGVGGWVLFAFVLHGWLIGVRPFG